MDPTREDAPHKGQPWSCQRPSGERPHSEVRYLQQQVIGSIRWVFANIDPKRTNLDQKRRFIQSALTVAVPNFVSPAISVLPTDQTDLLLLRVASETYISGAADSTQEFAWAAGPSCPITAERMSMRLVIQQEIYGRCIGWSAVHFDIVKR